MLDNTGGDNFAMSEDIKVIADDFHYSADLTIKSGDAQCAALLVGVGAVSYTHLGSGTGVKASWDVKSLTMALSLSVTGGSFYRTV